MQFWDRWNCVEWGYKNSDPYNWEECIQGHKMGWQNIADRYFITFFTFWIGFSHNLMNMCHVLVLMFYVVYKVNTLQKVFSSPTYKMLHYIWYFFKKKLERVKQCISEKVFSCTHPLVLKIKYFQQIYVRAGLDKFKPTQPLTTN